MNPAIYQPNQHPYHLDEALIERAEGLLNVENFQEINNRLGSYKTIGEELERRRLLHEDYGTLPGAFQKSERVLLALLNRIGDSESKEKPAPIKIEADFKFPEENRSLFLNCNQQVLEIFL